MDEGRVELNPFCSGHAFSTYGNLLVVGGHHPPSGDVFNPGAGGLSAVRAFNPQSLQWSDLGGAQLYCGLPEGPEAVKRRWYPTCVTLPGNDQPGNDQLFIVSGTSIHQSNPGDAVNGTYEFWPQQSGSPANRELEPLLSHNGGQGQTGHATYPFVFVLPTGNLLMHTNKVTQFFDLVSNVVDASIQPWFSTPDLIPRAYPNSGTAVLLPLLWSNGYNARVMLIGGGGGASQAPGTNPPPTLLDATNTCLRLDTSSVDNRWEGVGQTASMSFGRVMPDAVLLPDATVLVVGGAQNGEIARAANPVKAAECYDPVDNVWRERRSMGIDRGYHATALLLRDGRVMTAGSADNQNIGPGWPSGDREFRTEVFTPPYLFDRTSPDPTPASQPVILEVNSLTSEDPAIEIWYSPDGALNHFSVKFDDPLGRPIETVALIRSGSVTHGFNADQRYVGLAFTTNGDTLEVTPPPHGHVAPPGFYMLFIVTGFRVDYEHASTNNAEFKCPSVAWFVRLTEPPP